MSEAAPGLQELVGRLRRQIGPFNFGIVGGPSHHYGYHLGADDCPPGDYSTMSRRDRAGIRRYGGQFASAVDIGMGWRASRAWLRWLVAEVRAGHLPDVAEVIGSFDGRTCFRWDTEMGRMCARPQNDHLGHAHISIYRDAVKRDQSALLDRWTARGRRPRPTPPVEARRPSAGLSGPSKAPRATQAPQPTRLTPAVAVTDSRPVPALSVGLAAAATGLAWIIQRRNTLGGIR